MTDFPAFTGDIERRFGPEAAMVRHELFFLGRHAWPAGRATAALWRDALMLCARTGPAVPEADGLAVLVVTLGGSAGWDTLGRAVDPIRRAGLKPVILAHPRLGSSLFPADLPLCRLFRPRVTELTVALAATRASMVAATIARRRLWRGCLARTLGPRRGWLVLHNDFDMMSAAAIGLGWPAISLQHGIPTDEFFPARADRHLVWGASSARAYACRGVPPETLLEDALGRSAHAFPVPATAPAGIALLSQSHAAIFGADLGPMLARFADGLGRAAPGSEVLLHPRETSGHPYGAAPGLVLRSPPHALLGAASDRPWLVVGYCSTAMLDAGRAGHWVAGLEPGLAGNQAARSVALPPLRVGSAEEAVRLRDRLADPTFRSGVAVSQQRWLADTFTADRGAFETMLCREAVR
ncbi:MAG: hypothetical protein WCO00_14980 [Rhodospirillaceae bacterium]